METFLLPDSSFVYTSWIAPGRKTTWKFQLQQFTGPPFDHSPPCFLAFLSLGNYSRHHPLALLCEPVVGTAAWSPMIYYRILFCNDIQWWMIINRLFLCHWYSVLIKIFATMFEEFMWHLLKNEVVGCRCGVQSVALFVLFEQTRAGQWPLPRSFPGSSLFIQLSQPEMLSPWPTDFDVLAAAKKLP